jgi:hypothetical protein
VLRQTGQLQSWLKQSLSMPDEPSAVNLHP